MPSGFRRVGALELRFTVSRVHNVRGLMRMVRTAVGNGDFRGRIFGRSFCRGCDLVCCGFKRIRRR